MAESKPSFFQRAFSADENISKDEIANILFVVKQVLSILIGIAIGFSSLQGIYGFAAYAAAISLICYLYVMKVLQPEEDTVEVIDIVKEHFMLGLFSFLMAWIITFNLVNY